MLSNVPCDPAVGGRLSPNCKLGFTLGASTLNKLQSATCRCNVQRKAIKSYDLLQIACACVKSGSYHVLLCAPVPSRPTRCRLSPRWPGVKEESNVPCAPAASSGMLVVTKVDARFHFGCVGFESCCSLVCLCLFLNCAPLVLSESAAWCSPILVAAVVALTLHRLVVRHCACVPVPSSRPT